jgi:hypothetical protein
MGQPLAADAGVARSRQRIVLLAGDERSDLKGVLEQYQGTDLDTVCIYQRARELAADHAGKYVAVEWRDEVLHIWRRLLWAGGSHSAERCP